MFISPLQYFRTHGGRPAKHLGQHFLTQPKTAKKIVDALRLKPHETVMEIGPGLGALTRYAIQRAQCLHLIEIDKDLASHLVQILSRSSDGASTVHCMDVMDFPWDVVYRESSSPLVLLGNLPYQITSPLMFRLLEHRKFFDRAIFMVQKEVGDRLVASPGHKSYGVLSVLLGIYCETKALFRVGPGQFYPPPKVDSLVISVDFSVGHHEDLSLAWCRQVANVAFQRRRKVLINAFKGLGFKGRELKEAMTRVRIDPYDRVERIDPRRFASLTRELEAMRLPDRAKMEIYPG